MKARKLALVLVAGLFASCSTAGPFVTSISSDGRGNLIVEKSMVKYNSFTGTVSNESTSTTTIRLVSLQPVAAQPAQPQPAPAGEVPVWTGEN